MAWESLSDFIVTVDLFLENPEEWRDSVKGKVKSLMTAVDSSHGIGGVPRDPKLKEFWDLLVSDEKFHTYKKALKEKHFGDCTKHSCPCSRCHAEVYFQQESTRP